MTYKELISRTIPIAVLLLYLCLRCNDQWFEDPPGPQPDFTVIKQKTIKSAPDCVTCRDSQNAPEKIVACLYEIIVLVPAPTVKSDSQSALSGIHNYADSFGARAPPAS